MEKGNDQTNDDVNWKKKGKKIEFTQMQEKRKENWVYNSREREKMKNDGEKKKKEEILYYSVCCQVRLVNNKWGV